VNEQPVVPKIEPLGLINDTQNSLFAMKGVRLPEGMWWIGAVRGFPNLMTLSPPEAPYRWSICAKALHFSAGISDEVGLAEWSRPGECAGADKVSARLIHPCTTLPRRVTYDWVVGET
jgi:hypothetical protein